MDDNQFVIVVLATVFGFVGLLFLAYMEMSKKARTTVITIDRDANGRIQNIIEKVTY